MNRRSIGCAVFLAVASLHAAKGQQAPLTFDQNQPGAPAYGQPPQGGAPLPATSGVATGALTPAPDQSAPAGPAAAVAPAGAMPPAPPFQLDAVQLQYVIQTLQTWQGKSADVNSFKAEFDRWEYDAVWGPGADKPMIQSTGVLSYKKPDQGSFKIDAISRWTKNNPQDPAPDAPGQYVLQKEEVGEHWVCDGKAIYEYEHRLKQLRVTPIPPDMRGAAIVDGPLPFLFGANTQKLMERYWIRGVQPPKELANRIWLEAYPKRQADAANYDRVDVQLNSVTMQPVAIQVHMPGGKQRHVYIFKEPTINGKIDALFGGLFKSPWTPPGWKKVVTTETELPPGPQAAHPGAGLQR